LGHEAWRAPGAGSVCDHRKRRSLATAPDTPDRAWQLKREALAEHARHVGETAGFTVHLELSETPQRLRPQVESEVFRIAQEAITNVRKHARAENLWVTCSVQAPSVKLIVSDDGHGLLAPRDDSFGLSIMKERAHRAGCPRGRGKSSREPRTAGRSAPARPRRRRPVAVRTCRRGLWWPGGCWAVSDVHANLEAEGVAIEGQGGLRVVVWGEARVDGDVHGGHVSRGSSPALLDS
jgi:hypothetical protein